MNESPPGYPDPAAPSPSVPPPFPADPPAALGQSRAAGWEQATMERLMLATLEEQRTARRWRNFFRLSWLALIVFALWAAFHRGSPATDKSTPHTAVVEVKGEIASGADASAEFIVA